MPSTSPSPPRTLVELLCSGHGKMLMNTTADRHRHGQLALVGCLTVRQSRWLADWLAVVHHCNWVFISGRVEWILAYWLRPGNRRYNIINLWPSHVGQASAWPRPASLIIVIKPSSLFANICDVRANFSKFYCTLKPAGQPATRACGGCEKFTNII